MCNTPPQTVTLRGTKGARVTPFQPVLAGIDTLHLHSTAPVRPALAAELKTAREEAKLARREAEPVKVQLGHLRMPLKPYGTRRGPYVLENELVAITLNPDAGEPFPTVSVELRALALWKEGWESAAQAMVRVIEACVVGDAAVQVSRADICVDFQGWVPTPDLSKFFVCKGRSRSLWWNGQRLTGFSFGRGDVSARLYDKREEIEVSGKLWFEKLWKRAPGYDADAPVWRLEFQLRRQALKDLQPLFDFGAWKNLRVVVPNLWELLTDDWLCLQKRTKKKRGVVLAPWKGLQAVTDFGQAKRAPVGVYRKRIQGAHAETVPQLAGYLARCVAEERWLQGEKVGMPLAADENEWFWNVIDKATTYLEERGSSFEEKVRVLLRQMLEAEAPLSEEFDAHATGVPEAWVSDFQRRNGRSSELSRATWQALRLGDKAEAREVAARLALASAVEVAKSQA